MRDHTTLFLVLFVLVGLSVSTAFAQEPELLRSSSAAQTAHKRFGVSISAGYETGAIPTAAVGGHLSYGITDRLQGEIGTCMGFFTDRGERRIAHVDVLAQYLLLDSAPTGFNVSAYGGARVNPGEAVTVEYEGDTPLIHTVVAEHGDRGLDLTLGAKATTGPLLFNELLHLGATADYAYTGMRDYYPAFSDGAYKHRIAATLFPFMPLTLGNRELLVSLQTRYVHWFARGSMLELLPQGELALGRRMRVTLGISAPLIGGRVFKILGRVTFGMQPQWQRQIRITIRDLYFPPNQAMLYGPENERTAQNRRRIKRLYRQLERYPEYRIIVEGHTSWVYWDDPVRGPREQEDVLIPLSRARAGAVVDALVELGLPRERMSFVGKGALEPKVPFSDSDQWRNRRVEVVLVRE